LQTSSSSAAQGAETSVVATITRVDGGPTPSVTVENVPSGVTASLVNTDPVAGVFRSTLTLRVSSDAKVGQYSVAIRAHAEGVVDAVLTVALTVLDAPKLALTLTRPTVTVTRGGLTPTTLAIGRTTVSAPVTLALEGAPDCPRTSRRIPSPGIPSALSSAPAHRSRRERIKRRSKRP
jgi:hypothetical protein